ncbi:hypothetical protein KIW84_058387 [Lathyrus oleraceus]|uniref:Uncharacterized protein n=1 Tax=Pisum sativum TaxID=3888 RepID=A0A9D4X665_PEA|nr:hypothetical protein KIW84_058387 [Pisum sativum]
MRNTAAMTKINRTNQLLKVLPRNLFLHLPFGNFREKLAAFDVFNNHEHFGFVRHNLFEFNDVRMTNETHNRNFAFDLFHESLFFELLLFNHFYSNVLVGANVSSMKHFGEISLT